MNNINELFESIRGLVATDNIQGYKNLLYAINQANGFEDKEILFQLLDGVKTLFDEQIITENTNSANKNENKMLEECKCNTVFNRKDGFIIDGHIYNPAIDGPVDNAVMFQFRDIIPRSLKSIIVRDLRTTFGTNFPVKDNLEGEHVEW